jgi:hypothetical protein
MPYDTYQQHQIERTKSPPKSAAPTRSGPAGIRCVVASARHHGALAGQARTIPGRDA